MIYLFNSIDFVLFFIVVFLLYWLTPKRFKNIFLLIACYLFYVSWNWKFLSLILISTLVNYFCGLAIYNYNAKNLTLRRLYLVFPIITDISILGFFKYYDFFVESLVNFLRLLGVNFGLTTLNVILPLGISFYTFEIIGYIVDIYKKEFTPTENIIDFALFVAYFPKLISGPIERAKNLIPQIQAEKLFRNINFREGLYLFVYGLFKKIVIADSLAPIVNSTFASTTQSGAQILIAAYAFAIQLYCDFSGYIDMARGVSHFFGIKLSTNFITPYLAKNPHDFWARWHITLSSWVRDYVYIPLGGHNSRFFAALPLLISWFIMGLWHGAAMNFVVWGMYWFVIVFIYHIIKSIKFNFTDEKLLNTRNKFLQSVKNLISILFMFHVITFGWIIFRSLSLAQIIAFAKSLISGIDITVLYNISYLHLYTIMLFLIIYEVLQSYLNDELFITKKNFYYQLTFYTLMFLMLINIEAVSNSNFLYFQF